MFLRVLCVAALASLLAACGGGGGDSGDSSNGLVDSVSLKVTAPTSPVPSNATTKIDFEVTNPGTVAANDVALTMTLGAGLSIAGITCAAPGGVSVTCLGQPETMRIQSLPPGASVQFTVSIAAAAGASGSVRSSAMVTAANDSVTSNNSAVLDLAVYAADVSVVGAADATNVFSGSNVVYSLTVSNAGPDAARNVVLDNVLSSAQTVTSMTCSASGAAVCPETPSGHMTIDSLPSGASLTFSVAVQLSMNAVVSVSDMLSATVQGDGDLGNNTAIVAAETRIPTSIGSPSFVVLHSDVGDYIGDYYGRGASFSYTRANAVFEVQVLDDWLYVKVNGDEEWSGNFMMPAGVTQPVAGRYTDRRGAPYFDPTTAYLDFGGGGRGCDSSGWFQIDKIIYAQGAVAALDLSFEQHCDGIMPAMRGQIHWVAGDETRPPGPVNPVPAGLWQPASGATPASGNYVYMQSDADDFVGEGRTITYTQADAVLSVDAYGEQLGVRAAGDHDYSAAFRVMSPLTQMQPGYYANVQGWSRNPTVGRMGVTGDSHSCEDVIGWFAIDNITYSGNTVTALDLRFEQHCEGATPAIRGKVHWRSDDPTQPPGPQVPPPAGLWAPPAGVVPATGNFVYLQSDFGDFIGGGKNYLYTPLDSVLDLGDDLVPVAGNRFHLRVRGDEQWDGDFQTMNTLSDLRPGYYGDLRRYPFQNLAKGGLDWGGEGRGCNDLSGWFVIDSVTYSGSTLTSIELRFEQHCEFRSPALRGMIRWSAADTRQPPPPQNPPPSGLWDADASALPSTGNYVYMQSDAGDYVGRGQTYLFTSANSDFELRATGSLLHLGLSGDTLWSGHFSPMVPLAQLQVGYYGNLTTSNIARGHFDWGGDGRGCGIVTGWFVVDEVTFEADVVKSLDVRFEQHCGEATPALHGKIHWRFDNPP